MLRRYAWSSNPAGLSVLAIVVAAGLGTGCASIAGLDSYEESEVLDGAAVDGPLDTNEARDASDSGFEDDTPPVDTTVPVDTAVADTTLTDTTTDTTPADSGTVDSSPADAAVTDAGPTACYAIRLETRAARLSAPNTGWGVGTADWTIELWMKHHGSFTGGSITGLNEAYAAHHVRLVYDSTTGLVACGTYRDSCPCGKGSGNLTLGGGAINDGKWHHVACVRTGGSGKLYIDGALIDTDVISTTMSATSNVAIGLPSGYPSYDAAPVLIGPYRFSSVARYTAAFTPVKVWSVDASTVTQYLTSKPFAGSLVDEAGGENTSVSATNVSASTDSPCDPAPVERPSCGGLVCGSTSCCDSKVVPGGSFAMGRSAGGTDACPAWASPPGCLAEEVPEHPATVSSFKLDTYEVTVGRFRKFVDAFPGSKPVAGAGAHPKLGAASGWNASWLYPADKSALIASIKCPNTTWTDAPGANENRPINCVTWYDAFAFCAWDKARLPTEAEWEYAAAGGSENRLVPWGGTAAPDCAHAILGGCAPSTWAVVGSAPAGVSRWGQHDLAGNVWEWLLDEAATYGTGACSDCANIAFATNRVNRGGGKSSAITGGRAAFRQLGHEAVSRDGSWGIRCASEP